MFCPKCGREMSEQDRYCPACGEPNAACREPSVQNQPTVESFFFAPPEQAQASNYNRGVGDFSAYESADPQAQEPPRENPILGTLAIILCSIFGMTPGLVLAIIGLVKYKEPKNRKKCVIAIIIFVAWIVFSFFFGIALGILEVMSSMTSFLPFL